MRAVLSICLLLWVSPAWAQYCVFENPATNLPVVITRSSTYQALGEARAATIQPINGSIVVVGVGMSSSRDLYAAWDPLITVANGYRAEVDLVHAAIGGHGAEAWATSATWGWAADQVTDAGYTVTDVQAIVMLNTTRHLGATVADHQATFHTLIDQALSLAEATFPNLAIVYLPGVYTGKFSDTVSGHYEPHNWATNVEIQSVQDTWTGSAWVGGMASLWSDGAVPNAEGFALSCQEIKDQGSHLTDAGNALLAAHFSALLAADSTTAGWLFDDGTAPPPPPPPLYDVLIDGQSWLGQSWADALGRLVEGATIQQILKQ